MKRVDLIRTLTDLGCVLERHGARHDWYRHPVTGVAQAVPRHRDVNEHLAKRIIRLLTPPDDTNGDAELDDASESPS
jgi:mRNA interferase HicA